MTPNSIVIVVAALLVVTTGLCVYYQLNTQDTNQDTNPKNAVVKEALRVCTQDFGTQGGTIIILSNDQIEDVQIPGDLMGVKLQVLSRGEIDAKAAVDGPFLYLVLDEVSVYDKTAFVSYYLTGVFDSGAGGSINLTLENGIWVGEGGFWWTA